MTTVKSDDVYGRRTVEQEIVKPSSDIEVEGGNGSVLLGNILPGYTGRLGAFDELVYTLRCLGLDFYETKSDYDEYDDEDESEMSPEDKLRKQLSKIDE